ncbi:MAG: PPOX class F420-dependent oxidoreductase [Candidatus Dormibacteria bacterium]
MADLTDKQRAVLKGKNFYTVSTVGKDGGPRSTTVWGDLDGDEIVVNTREGRSWVANLRRDPRVAVAVHDMADPYNQVSLVCRAVSITEEGGQEGINHLSEKFTGEANYKTPPGETRLAIRLAIDHARSWGD